MRNEKIKLVTKSCKHMRCIVEGRISRQKIQKLFVEAANICIEIEFLKNQTQVTSEIREKKNIFLHLDVFH